MKTTHRLLMLVGLILSMALPVSAQTILNNTTFGAAVGADDTTVTVASASTLAADQVIVVPGITPEAMRIISVSGTSIRVVRAIRGTARAHASGDTIFTGVPERFYDRPPDSVNGTCTRSSLQYQPWVDFTSGIVWSCNGEGTNTTGTWYGGIANVVAYNSIPVR